jgi:hypothetical protein
MCAILRARLQKAIIHMMTISPETIGGGLLGIYVCPWWFLLLEILSPVQLNPELFGSRLANLGTIETCIVLCSM